MRLGSRLLVILLPAVLLIMGVYGVWALREREAMLVTSSTRAAQAYAATVGVTFEYLLRNARPAEIREVLNGISRAPDVYGVALYDRGGARLYASDLIDSTGTAPPELIGRVLGGADSLVTERLLGTQRVYSILQAVHDKRGRTTGVLEVAQPLDFVDAEQAAVRRRFLFNTATLLGAITLLTLVVVRRVVNRPLERLVEATRRLGAGQLEYRIAAPARGGELELLAGELDRMAANLQSAQGELRRETEERVALERRLRESEKLAAVGNLAASLAHEIGSPLNVIGGRAELMLAREPESGERQRHLRIIVQQIQRITGIVRNLLDFARRRAPQPQPVPLAAAIGAVLEFLEHEVAARELVVERTGDPDAVVRADADQLQQILGNLCLNALQAMDAGAPPRVLRLHVRRADEPSPAGEAGDWPARWVTLDVIDSGPGVPEEHRERLFEPFYSTKRRGTGLGLVVARSIAEEHGGSLSLTPTATGACFTLVLPRAARGEVTDA